MANTKSALKRMRTNERKRQRNQAVRSKVRTLVKKATTLAPTTLPESDDALRQALKALDQAAAKGVIHRNNAARRKSRLMRRYNLAHGIGQQATAKQ